MNAVMTINKAVAALAPGMKQYLQAEKAAGYPEAAAVVQIHYADKRQQFRIIVEPSISERLIPFIAGQAENAALQSGLAVILLTKAINENLRNELALAGINYVDEIGNIFIKGTDFLVHGMGKKPAPRRKVGEKNRIFQEAGVRLLFGILNHPAFLNLTYREMAKAARISLGSVNIIMNELVAAKYVAESANGEKRVLHFDDLVMRWALAFQEVLKPKLLLGNFTFWDKSNVRNYGKIDVAKWGGLWGGEAAGGIYSGHLVPEKLSQFVPDGEKQWLTGMKLVPATADWDVEILSEFWMHDHPFFLETTKFPNVVPPLLAYADLVLSADERNRETANIIYEKYLQPK